MLTTFGGIAVIADCFGIGRTGKRCATGAIRARQRERFGGVTGGYLRIRPPSPKPVGEAEHSRGAIWNEKPTGWVIGGWCDERGEREPSERHSDEGGQRLECAAAARVHEC